MSVLSKMVVTPMQQSLSHVDYVNYTPPPRFYLTKILLGFILLFLLGIFFKIYLTNQTVTLNNGSRLIPTNCWFEESWFSTNRCAYFYPAPRVDKPGVQIRMPVVVLKHNLLPFFDKTPVLYLAGGPGGSSYINQFGINYWRQWLKGNDWQHDLVLFEQRGTGMSQPDLRCHSEVDNVMEMVLQQDLSVSEEMQQFRSAYSQCYHRLKGEGVNLQEFTTEYSSQDVHDLLNALGYAQWNLYGVSYGTRLALSVLRDYPAQVRSAVLDSVYPPNKDSLFNLPYSTHQALENLFKGCHDSLICRKRFPDLRQNFKAILSRLEKDPAVLQVLLAERDETIEVVITPSRFINVVFNALYHWDLIELLPLIIHTVAKGRDDNMQRIVDEYVVNLFDQDFSDGMNLSVECHDENAEISEQMYLSEVNKYPLIAPYIKSLWRYNPCSIWDSGHASERQRSPVHAAIPTLFLTGKYDPVTPSVWAYETSQNFVYSHVFQFNDIGHAVIDSDNCAAMLTKKFLKNPYKEPDDDCLDWVEEPNFEILEL